MKNDSRFWQRVGAFALDDLLILGYLILITLVFMLLNVLLDTQWLFAERARAQFVAFLLVTLPVTLYFAACESSSRQATWGKQRLKLQVADAQGNRISFWRAFARTLLKFIPWELSHTLIWQINFSQETYVAWISYGFGLVYLLIGLNIASIFITSTRQTLYDLLSSTYVTSTQ